MSQFSEHGTSSGDYDKNDINKQITYVKSHEETINF